MFILFFFNIYSSTARTLFGKHLFRDVFEMATLQLCQDESLNKVFVLINTAAQSPGVCCDTAMLLCQRVGGRAALMTQDYQNQSPSPLRKAEVRLSAYTTILIGLTHCDTGGSGARRGTRAGRALTGLSSHTWTDWLEPCVRVHFPTCDAPLEQWGGNSARDAVWRPSGCAAMDHVDIPSLSNNITAAQQLTIK